MKPLGGKRAELASIGGRFRLGDGEYGGVFMLSFGKTEMPLCVSLSTRRISPYRAGYVQLKRYFRCWVSAEALCVCEPWFPNTAAVVESIANRRLSRSMLLASRVRMICGRATVACCAC